MWPLLILVALGCNKAPEFTEEEFDLVGLWAIEDVETDDDDVPTATQIEFADDGTWTLVDQGDRCEAPPFEAWFCEGAGSWSLAPDSLLADDDATLTIVYDGEEEEWDYDGYFDGDPDHFCWKMTLLGIECLLRQ